jgi:hypothetical protein
VTRPRHPPMDGPQPATSDPAGGSAPAKVIRVGPVEAPGTTSPGPGVAVGLGVGEGVGPGGRLDPPQPATRSDATTAALALIAAPQSCTEESAMV